MNCKISIGFLSKSALAPFNDQVNTVVTKMTDNATFAGSVPPIATVATSYGTYQDASAKAVKGGAQAIALRNTAKAGLVALLRQMAASVMTIANGDLVKLQSSGFPLQKSSRTPVGPLPAPAAPVVSQGPVSGVLQAITPRVSGASTYNWSVALESDPDTDVQTLQTTGARATFPGLTPGKVYLICVNAVGAAGVSDWSDYGSLMVI